MKIDFFLLKNQKKCRILLFQFCEVAKHFARTFGGLLSAAIKLIELKGSVRR